MTVTGTVGITKIIIVAAALTGCVLVPVKYPAYTHPTKTAEQFTADKYDCDNVAKQLAGQGMLPMALGNPLEAEARRCLSAKHGWVPAAK